MLEFQKVIKRIFLIDRLRVAISILHGNLILELAVF